MKAEVFETCWKFYHFEIFWKFWFFLKFFEIFEILKCFDNFDLRIFFFIDSRILKYEKKSVCSIQNITYWLINSVMQASRPIRVFNTIQTRTIYFHIVHNTV